MFGQKLSVLLTAGVAALWCCAAPQSWDFSVPTVWTQSGANRWSHDFGPLGEPTPEGFHFRIDDRDHRLWLQQIQLDPARAGYLEIYHRGRGMLFGVYVYGQDEHGYDASRRLSDSWTANDRFYPERKILELNKIPRWKAGGVKTMCIAFANSGEGSDATIQAMAFRRGQDTLLNGAFLLRDKAGKPLFWNVPAGTKLKNESALGLPVCEVPGGTLSTALDSLRPGNRYRASFYAAGALPQAAIRIFDRSGKVAAETAFTAGGAEKDFTLYTAEYVVPETAFRGELAIEFSAPGRVADALVEDEGGAVSWQAEWIWTPEGAKDHQQCWFRREFTVDDPSRLAAAFIQGTCDDAFTLEVNNNRVANNNNWSSPQFADVLKYLKPGKNVITANGVNGSSAAGLLCELKLVGTDGKEQYIASDASWLCRTSDPGENWRRIEPPEAARSGWVPAQSIAKPPAGPWGSYVKYLTAPPEPGPVSIFDEKTFEQGKTVARINHELNYPRIEINGRIADPVIFGVRWRGDRTASYRTSKSADFNLFRLSWEFSFEAWRADGTVDYDGLEHAVRELLQSNPAAKIIIEMRITPPPWWTQANPGELVKFADGQTTGADGVFASPASAKWKRETTAKLREVIDHIEKSWFAGAIAGYMPCNLRGPEWVIACKHNCYPDYSDPMRDYFRGYLKEKYGNDIEKLRAAWNNSEVTFDSAAIPEQKQRQLATGYFLPPERQDVMDYNRAVSRATVDAIIAVMDAIHAAAPDKLRVLYFGYLMTLDHISANPAPTSQYDLSRLLDAGKVDVMASPVSYVWRKPGDISGTGSVESSYRKHGVVWLQEADNRSYLTLVDDHAVTFHAEASLRENRREFIYALAKREAIWFYELGGGWYDNPYFCEDFRKMHEIYRAANTVPVTYQPPMAMFFDEKCFDGVSLSDGRWGGNRPWILAAEAQRMVAVSGVPYDIYELEDLYDLDLAPYSVLVFPNAWRANPKLAEFLKSNVYAAGKTAVWIYAPGYGQKGGLDGMSALTGFGFRQLPAGTPLQYRTGDGRMIGYPGMNLAETFGVAGKDVRSLGSYPGANAVAAAWKKIGPGTSVYLPVHDPSGKLLREAFARAGVAPVIDRADRVVFDGVYLGVIATDGPGRRTVTVPGKTPAGVADAFSGEDIALDGNRFGFDAVPGDARLFKLRFP